MAELIVFFSRADQNYVNGEIKNLTVGNTEVAAGMIQKLTGADIFKIEPRHAYSKDYNECIAQAQDDQRRDVRPKLTGYPTSIDPYENIYLGFPNYWGTMPMAVYTFLEHFDFTGKTILYSRGQRIGQQRPGYSKAVSRSKRRSRSGHPRRKCEKC